MVSSVGRLEQNGGWVVRLEWVVCVDRGEKGELKSLLAEMGQTLVSSCCASKAAGVRSAEVISAM